MKGLSSRHFVKVLFITLTLTMIWSGWTLSQLSTEYSVKQFYPKNHPLLKKDREIRQTFRLNESSPFLFVITLDRGQSWLDKAQIKKLQDLSLVIQSRTDVGQALSLTLVEGAQQTKNELLVGNIFDRTPQSQWKQAILSNPLLYPMMVTSDFKSTLLIVEPKARSTADLEKFHGKLQGLIQKKFSSGQVLSAGVPLIQTRLSKMIQIELSKFLIAAVLVFCVVFYFLFSHWTAIVSTFLTLISGNMFSLALLAAFDIPMNIVLVTLPIISSVSIMSLLIHTLHLWSQKPASKSSEFSERWKGALSTMKELGLANMLGAWTTALGFLALYPSPIPMIREYGWVVAVVVGLISIYSQAFILLSLPFVKPRMRAWFDKPAYWALYPIRHFKAVFLSLVAVSLVGAVLSKNLNFSGRLFDDLPIGDGVRASTEWIDQVFGGIVPYEVILNSKSEGFWKQPKQLKDVERVAEHLRKHPSIGSVVTVSDFFQSGVPQTKGTVAETFFLFSMAERNPLSNIMTENAKNLRLMIRLKDEPAAQIEKTKAWIQQSLGAMFPKVNVKEGGMAAYAHDINQEVSKELVFGFWQSLVGIGLFLVLMFRSVRWALVACLPNLIPPALLMGALSVTGVAVKPGVALIFSIALGFAFNNTVYLLTRVRSLMKDQNLSFLPLKRALLMEANPCFFESLVMLIGFSIFAFSDFSMNQTFGIFMMISIVAGFLGDLYFLPAMLKVFPQLLIGKPKKRIPTKTGGDSKNEDDEMEDMPMSKVAALFILGFIFMAGTPVQAQTAQDILKKSQSQLDAKDDQARVEMKIIEKNGETKTRVIEMKTLRDEGFSVIAKIESPADIKGMGFLGHVKGGKESQWIYLPSSGQVRRVVAGKSKGGLLGSEISPEDLNSKAIKSANVKLAKHDARTWWIEIVPAKGTSAYSKALTQISKKDFLPRRTQYFSGKRLKKTVEFKNYAKVGNTYRAQLIDVKNHLNGRGTQIKLSQMKINRGLSSEDFSQSALKDD